MKIAVVSKADATGGGASRVANDVVVCLNKTGAQVKHFTIKSSQGWNEKRESILGGRLQRAIITSMQSIMQKAGLGDIIPFEAIHALLSVWDYDVVHFHDTSSAFSPLTLLLIAHFKPLIWTIHDCSPFTGGCLYPQLVNCLRYQDNCGSCPKINDWPLNGGIDTTSIALNLRRLLHAKGHITTVTPSNWMKDVAVASGNVYREPVVISNMVDTSQFHDTADRMDLRRRLNLRPDGLVVALSSDLLSDIRKGVDDGIACIKRLRHLAPTLVMIGNPDPTLHERLEGVDYIPTGYIRDREMLRCWLSASDLFLFMSKADNQPLSIAEALACGTPVYGYPTGGAAEMIVDGQTGRFSQTRSPADLAAMIEDDVRTGHLSSMRSPSRQHAEASFGEGLFVERHLDLYATAIKAWKKS